MALTDTDLEILGRYGISTGNEETAMISPSINEIAEEEPKAQSALSKVGGFVTDVMAGGAKKLGETLGTAAAAGSTARDIGAANVGEAESQRQLAQLLNKPGISDVQKQRIRNQLGQGTQVPTAGEQVPTLNKTGKQVAGEALQTTLEALSGGTIGKAASAKNVFQALINGGKSGAVYGLLSGTAQGLEKDEDVKGIIRSAATGAATGAAVGGAVGAAGYGVSQIPKTLDKKSDNIYRSVLKMTASEKIAEKKQGKDTAALVKELGLTGGVDDIRDNLKVIYDGKAEELGSMLKTAADSGSTVNVNEFESGLISKLDKYKTHVAEYGEITGKIKKIIDTTRDNFGDDIPVDVANAIKQGLWSDSFNKTGTDITNEAVYEAGNTMKTLIEKAVPDEQIAAKNAELGKYIVASKQLIKSAERPQVNRLARWIRVMLGAGIGASTGGVLGAVGGAAAGSQLERVLTSPTLRTNVAQLMSKAAKATPEQSPKIVNELKDLLIRHLIMESSEKSSNKVKEGSNADTD